MPLAVQVIAKPFFEEVALAVMKDLDDKI